MADGYNRCKKCGVVYIDEGKGYCPTCGTFESSDSDKRSGLFYHFDSKEFIGIVILAIITIAFAAYNIYRVWDLNNSIAQERTMYEMAQSMLDSGLYDAAVDQYGYDSGYSSAYMHSAMAKIGNYFGFVDAVSIGYVISCSALIIGALLMIFRFRFSFKVMMGAYILAIAVICIFDIWGMISYKLDTSAVGVGIRVAVAASLLKSLWRYDQMAYEDVKSEKGWISVAPAAAGVPMPAVKELNADFDSFIAQTPPDKEMESVGLPKADDTQMSSVAPVGTAVPTERDKLFQPTDVAPSVQPVMPLQDASARRADVGVMTGEAVTPLDRPMIPVDMMEDEAMPDISLSQAEAQPAPTSTYTAPQPVQSATYVQPMQTTPAVSKGIWFCSKCGSLNENANFCNSCGSPKG